MDDIFVNTYSWVTSPVTKTTGRLGGCVRPDSSLESLCEDGGLLVSWAGAADRAVPQGDRTPPAPPQGRAPGSPFTSCRSETWAPLESRRTWVSGAGGASLAHTVTGQIPSSVGSRDRCARSGAPSGCLPSGFPGSTSRSPGVSTHTGPPRLPGRHLHKLPRSPETPDFLGRTGPLCSQPASEVVWAPRCEGQWRVGLVGGKAGPAAGRPGAHSTCHSFQGDMSRWRGLTDRVRTRRGP